VSAVTVPLRGDAHDVPAVIAGAVNLMRFFSEALARAGLVGPHDAARGVLVIEPAPEALIQQGAQAGMAWYNRLSQAERRHCHAGSAATDAWRKPKSYRVRENTRGFRNDNNT
jgi:hypothetical protein